MDCGKVLYAMHDGTWVLRLTGDVRATWCAALDALLERRFADVSLRNVVVDLRDTTNIDSTMLGVLARIGIRSRDRLHQRPLLVAPNPDVRRLLDTLCLDKVLNIVDDATLAGCECSELPLLERSNSELCSQVTGAHRALMDLDERNRNTFKDVVASLEEEQQRAGGR